MLLVGGALESWLGHEGGALMNGMSALIKSSLAPFAMSGYKEKSATQKGALALPYWHPDLSLLALRTVRNKFLLFISYPVCNILFWQPEWTDAIIQTIFTALEILCALSTYLFSISLAPGNHLSFYCAIVLPFPECQYSWIYTVL